MQVLLFLLFLQFPSDPSPAWVQTGKPHIQNIRFSQYVSGRQNWCIAQNSRGIMYLANENGVLEYDGHSWTLIPIKENLTPYWIDIDSRDNIFVGSYGEIGYLLPDASGRMQYHSLMDLVPENFRDFKEVWEVRITGNFVYFRSFKYLFRYDGKSVTVFQRPGTADRFDVLSLIGDKPYFRIAGLGIYTLEGDSLVFLDGTEIFKDLKVNGIHPGPGGSLLIFSRFDGIFRYTGGKATLIPSPDQKLLKSAGIYDISRLDSGLFALVTFFNGVLITDSDGKIHQIYNEANGLTDSFGLFSYLDKENGLWIGHESGISRISFGLPVIIYDRTSGLSGNIQLVESLNGKKIVGTSHGLFELDETDTNTPDRLPKAKKISPNPEVIHAIFKSGSDVLAGMANSTVSFDGKSLKPVMDRGVDLFAAVPGVPDLIVYHERFYGAGILKKLNGRWVDTGPIPAFPYLITGMAVTRDKIWLGTDSDGLFCVDTAADETGLRASFSKPRRFQLEANGRKGLFLLPAATGDEVWCGSSEGLFRLQGSDFSAVAEFNAQLPESFRRIYALIPDSQNRLWVKTTNGRQYDSVVLTVSPAGKLVTAPVNLMNPWDKNFVSLISDPDGSVWMAIDDYLVHFRPGQVGGMRGISYQPTVSQVILNQDSVLAGRYYTGDVPELRFGEFRLRFVYTSPVYNYRTGVRYRVSCTRTGEPVWSSWSPEEIRDYSGLREGLYTFMVQAMDPDGRISEASSFTFRVLPPYYRTWWAFLVYLTALTGLVVFVVRYRTEQLKSRNRELENQVAVKTAMLVQSEKMAAMGELTSGLAHEINNPLTIIQLNAEMVEMTVAQALGEPEKEDLKPALSSFKSIFEGVRRIRLIVEKMSWFSVSEEFDRSVSAEDQLRAILSVVGARWPSIRISLQSELKEKDMVHGQAIKIVLYNILTNAAEAVEEAGTQGMLTSDGGKITVTARSEPGQLHFAVADNGTGISEQNQKKIFDPFFTTKPPGKGTGLGLFETYNSVRQMGGTIRVESHPGKGTTVWVSVPVPPAAEGKH